MHAVSDTLVTHQRATREHAGACSEAGGSGLRGPGGVVQRSMVSSWCLAALVGVAVWRSPASMSVYGRAGACERVRPG